MMNLKIVKDDYKIKYFCMIISDLHSYIKSYIDYGHPMGDSNISNIFADWPDRFIHLTEFSIWN